MEKITTVVVEHGDYRFAQTTTDEKGNVIRQVPPCWTTSPDGCNIVISPVNSDTREQSGEASLCAHWDTERVASQLFELLGFTQKHSQPGPHLAGGERGWPRPVRLLSATGEPLRHLRYCRGCPGIGG